jgi:hypothetical protein
MKTDTADLMLTPTARFSQRSSQHNSYCIPEKVSSIGADEVAQVASAWLSGIETEAETWRDSHKPVLANGHAIRAAVQTRLGQLQNESPHAGGQVGLLPTTKRPARTLTNWNGTVFAADSVPTLS